MLLEKGQLVAIPTGKRYWARLEIGTRSDCSCCYSSRPRNVQVLIHWSFIVGFRSMKQGKHIVRDFQNPFAKLASVFGQDLDLILSQRLQKIPDLLVHFPVLDRVAIRVPSSSTELWHAFSRMNFPFGTPSANPFGYISPNYSWSMSMLRLGGFHFQWF